MPGKNQVVVLLAILLLLQLLTMLAVPEAALAISGPGPPSIFIASEPASQAVQAGGSTIFKVSVYPQSDWKTGNVSLSLLNPPPQWITATFSPGNVTNVMLDGFTSNLEVKVAPDAPQRDVTLTIRGTGTANPHYPPNGPPIMVKLDAETDVTLTVTAPLPKTTVTTTAITTTTTTLTMETIQTQTVIVTVTQIGTSTNTLTTTVTTTTATINAEQASGPPNYAWALSAGVATIVLAAVLITQRRSG